MSGFGILSAGVPGRGTFRYAPTSRDAVWLARLIARRAEQGGRPDDVGFVWRVLRKFAVDAQHGGESSPWAQPGPSYGSSHRTLHRFLREHVPTLARTPWAQLPEPARRLALFALSGRLASSAPQAIVVTPGQASMPPRAYAPWRGNGMVYETTPTGGADANAAPNAGAPADASNGTAPPPDGASAPVDPMARAQPNAMPGDDPGAVAPPTDDPSGADANIAANWQTSDGDQLSLTPQLLQSLLARLRRRRRRHHGWQGGSGAGYTDGSNYDPTAYDANRSRWWSRRSWAQPGFGYGSQYGAQYGAQYGGWRPYASSAYRGYQNYGGYSPYRGYTNYRNWSPSRGYTAYHGIPTWRGTSAYRGASLGRSPFAPSSPIAARIGQLASNSRRVGTLRSRQTGARYPVFGGNVAGKSYRIVTRPRGGRGGVRYEIMSVRNGALEAELAV